MHRAIYTVAGVRPLIVAGGAVVEVMMLLAHPDPNDASPLPFHAVAPVSLRDNLLSHLLSHYHQNDSPQFRQEP
jgi:hypothetical protein